MQAGVGTSSGFGIGILLVGKANLVMQIINWEPKVVEDYRRRILVDANNPLLAFKASRDRYTNLPNQRDYAGLPHLGSWRSEDALTWNVFRSLQQAGRLDIIAKELEIGNPRSLLLWGLAPEIDDISSELQYVTGSLIRRFDGILPGQVTEPDAIILATSGIAVIECKLSEPDKAPTHLWEGTVNSVRKRRSIYQEELPRLINEDVSDEEMAPFYQLVRMAFFAMKLGMHFAVEPVVVSLGNEKNWSHKIRKIGKSPSELWEIFCSRILGDESPRCEALTWQSIRILIEGEPLDTLSTYLSSHPCL